MTRSPIESRLAVDRPDLPEYPLNQACPITGEVPGLEAHHLWRRREYPSYWVELPTGEIVGNRIMLSSQAHYRVTVNTARIAYEDGVFWWVEDDDWTELRWQPPTMPGRKAQEAAERLVEREETAEWLNAPKGPHIEPGHDCPTCRRRVPLPKKATSPDTKVFSTRVPVADVDTFKEILDAAAEHAGLKPKAHFAYWTILAGLTLILQAPREDLPDVG